MTSSFMNSSQGRQNVSRDPWTVRGRLSAEGDDLRRARDYCTQARMTMDAILMADRQHERSKGRDRHWLSERLADLQRGAKRLRALAIYRSTQDVLNVVQGRHAHAPVNWAIVDGRLVVLNKLIQQYTDGLSEVWAETGDMRSEEVATHPSEDLSESSDEAEAHDRHGPVLTRYGHLQKDHPTRRSITPTLASNTPSAVERTEQAAATLQSLLPHASEAEREALQSLIDYSGSVSSPSTGMTEEPPCDTGPSVDSEGDHVDLVSVMPDLVQTLLEEGREFGKALSVSYALEGVILCETARSSLLQRLHLRLSDLIAGPMPLQGIGHLDLTAEGNGLSISGSGFEPFTIDIIVNAEQRSEPDDSPAPRINETTEDELRAQLAALMDGGMNVQATDETAPSDRNRDHG